MSFGGVEFFNVKPKRAAPLIKIDVGDGELGYTVQLNANERKYEFSPPPEVAALKLELHNETFHELVLDFDFFTTQPMPTESLDIRVWLSGWNKALSRDADHFLDRLASLK